MTEPDTTMTTGPTTPAKRARGKPIVRANPGGSTAKVRGEVLAALGVLKVVTADQLWRLLRPQAKESKFARAALNDLAKARLVHSEGRTASGHKTWGLTAPGRDAAQAVMPTGREVGNIARGAGRSGAPHAMAVNETVIAFLRGGTLPGSPPGIGTIWSWTTEVPHDAPGKRRAQADAVLRAPEHDLPVLLVEVDRATEAPHILAAKLDTYAAYFAHQVTNPDTGQPRTRRQPRATLPVWQLAYGPPVREGHPPIAVVFTGASDTVLRNRMKTFADLTRPHWDAPVHGRDHYRDYGQTIPVVVTRLELLQQHGPEGPVWWRLGRTERQSLTQALDNPDDADHYWQAVQAQDEADRRAQAEAEQLRRHREREKSRCPDCRRARDEFADPDDAGSGKKPCRPCAREREQRERAAAHQALADAVRQHVAFLDDWHRHTAPWPVLARQLASWGHQLRDAWNARQTTRHEPEQPQDQALSQRRTARVIPDGSRPQPQPVPPAAQPRSRYADLPGVAQLQEPLRSHIIAYLERRDRERAREQAAAAVPPTEPPGREQR